MTAPGFDDKITREGTYLVNTTTVGITFTPVNGFQNASTIKYTVKDGNDLETEASIAVSVNCPLPITLVSFSTTKAEKTSVLNRSTTSETNSDHFEIQRSIDGKGWNKIDVKVLPAGVYIVKITSTNALLSTHQVIVRK